MTAQKQYNAYTLMEMLIVLGIFGIIAAIGFSSFYGLKDSITMNEKVLSVSQDFRYAQRSALFLERASTDKWIYGIGIDFSTVESDGKYKLFKWCSQFNDYGDVRTRGDFPNFDKTFSAGQLNGNLAVGNYAQSCVLGQNTSELVLLSDTGERNIVGFTVDLPSDNDASGDVGASPRYILFESVSGRTFFYDAVGNIINFDGSGKIVTSPISFKLSIKSERTNTKKTIEVSNISGKVNVQTVKER